MDLASQVGHFMRTFAPLSTQDKLKQIADSTFRTPFNMNMAVQYSDFAVRQALWPYLNPSQKTLALICACKPRHRCRDTVIMALGDNQVRPELYDNLAFIHACTSPFQTKDIEIVRLLLKHPFVNMEARNNFAFLQACDDNNLQLVLFLLQQGVSPTVNRYSTLWQAVRENQASLVSLLISYAPPSNHLRRQLLMMASPRVKQLLIKVQNRNQ